MRERLPQALLERNTLGCSSARVYKVVELPGGDNAYLKVQSHGRELGRE